MDALKVVNLATVSERGLDRALQGGRQDQQFIPITSVMI